MKVLGAIVGHDSSVCLVDDGKIVRYVAEERFNRLKVGLNGILDSLEYCLGDLQMDDIDKVVISGPMMKNIETFYRIAFNKNSLYGIPLMLRNKSHVAKSLSLVDHHTGHAASAYYTSGWDEALIVTIDGIGGETTHHVAVGRGRDIETIYLIESGSIAIKSSDGVFLQHVYKKPKTCSMGWMYGMATEALNFRMCCDEGKTMGLSPYGNADIVPMKEFNKFAYKRYPEGFYHDNGKIYYHFGGSEGMADLAKKFGRENLAAVAQKKLEDKTIRFINRWVKRTGIKKVCAAGGIFLNVKLNQRIKEQCNINDYYVFPLCSDTGVSVGLALYGYYKNNEYKPERIRHLYYGPEYSNGYIEAILKRNKIAYRMYDVGYVAKRLKENAIVGWFQGRMEGGPRALGNRSILMSPLRAENKDIINKYVKFRENFRPFCPSVTEEDANRYFDGGGPFMIISCNVKSKDIPAVTHVDNTARPQFVSKEINPKFHELISMFGKETGHPVLLNTSFNVMGEPIVNKPEEAIRCFYGVGMDMLVIGDCMIEKGEK